MENNLLDIISVTSGILGNLIKSIYAKTTIYKTTVDSITAALLAYCLTGVVAVYLFQNTPKWSILISFFVGYSSTMLTKHIDTFVGDIYSVFWTWIRGKFDKN
jgi:hypothetical protein